VHVRPLDPHTSPYTTLFRSAGRHHRFPGRPVDSHLRRAVMGSIVNLVAGFAAIVGGSARLVWPRRRPSPATRYMCGGVIAAGLSAALSAPAVLAAAAHVEPHPNVTRLLVNCIGMVAAWCAHSLLIHLVVDDAARARAAVRLQAVVLLVVITAMAALFLSAEMTYRPDFLDAFADVPEVYGYL